MVLCPISIPDLIQSEQCRGLLVLGPYVFFSPFFFSSFLPSSFFFFLYSSLSKVDGWLVKENDKAAPSKEDTGGAPGT